MADMPERWKQSMKFGHPKLFTAHDGDLVFYADVEPALIAYTTRPSPTETQIDAAVEAIAKHMASFAIDALTSYDVSTEAIHNDAEMASVCMDSARAAFLAWLKAMEGAR